jgi:hypothetical protein
MSTRPALTGFETRLLAELRQVVAERAASSALPGTAPLPSAPSPAAWKQAGRGWPRRGIAMTGALSAAAAAVTVALTVSLQGNGGPPAGPPHFAAATTAAAVLNNAALAAQSEPAVTPRPDQFVYLKLVEVTDFSAASRKAAASRGDPPVPSHCVDSAESWLTVSGTRRGLGVNTGHCGSQPAQTRRGPEPFCQNGVERAGIAQDAGTSPHGFHGFPCTPQQLAAFKPWLPSTTAGMLAYLEHHCPVKKPGTGHAESMLGSAFGLLASTDLTPAQQAAMFHALARVPHLHIVPRVADALGRTGVGIQVRDGRDTSTVIFDPRTFQPLGKNFSNPAVASREALAVPATVVDRTGQRP